MNTGEEYLFKASHNLSTFFSWLTETFAIARRIKNRSLARHVCEGLDAESS